MDSSYLPDSDDKENRAFHDTQLLKERLQINILTGKIEHYWFAELQNNQGQAALIRGEMHDTLDSFLDLIHDHADKLRQIKARKGL